MKTNEILTCLLFVIIGYFVASLFSLLYSSRNGFRVGVQRDDMDVDEDTCESFYDNEDDCEADGECEPTHYYNGEFRECITKEEDMNDYCENIESKTRCRREDCTWKPSEGCVWVDEDDEDDDLMAEFIQDAEGMLEDEMCHQLNPERCEIEENLTGYCRLTSKNKCIGACSGSRGSKGRCDSCNYMVDHCINDKNCEWDEHTEECGDK